MTAWGDLYDDLLPEFAARTAVLTHKDGLQNSIHPDVAVLVSRRELQDSTQEWVAPQAILHLSGFWGAFVNPELAINFEQQGWSFHALDMRRQGRAARISGIQIKENLQNLQVRFEEIKSSIELIRGRGAKTVVIHAQGGGALLAALYANAHEGCDGIILSSPSLDHSQPWVESKLGTWVSYALGYAIPKTPVIVTPPGLTQSAHILKLEEPIRGIVNTKAEPVTAGFVRSLRICHRKIAGGIRITVPILVACARRSASSRWPSGKDRHVTDCVLQVEDMLARVEKLGTDTHILRVEDGIHNLPLSNPVARKAYYQGVNEFLKTNFSATKTENQ